MIGGLMAGKYRRIRMKFWTDKKMRELSRDEVFVFFYLVTNPNSHMSGIYRLPLDYIVVDLSYWELTKERVLQAMDGLVGCGVLMWDQESDTVYIKKMLQYQGNTNNPKVMTGIESHLEDIETSQLKNQFRIDYRLPIDYQSISDPVQSDRNYPQEQLTGTGTGTGTGVLDLSLSQKPEEEKQPEVTIIGSSPATRFGDIELPSKDLPTRPSNIGNQWAVELRELQQYYADTWSTIEKSISINPKPVNGDLKLRMSYALEEYGYDACKKAIRGHHDLATVEGSKRGRSIDKAFPIGTKRGRQDLSRLDTEGFYFFVNSAPLSKKEKLQKEQDNKQEDSALVAPPSDEQIQKNLELIRETKRKLGIGAK